MFNPTRRRKPMTTASKRFIVWPVAILLGLVCSFQADAHDYGDYGWRPHHHHHREYYGWQRPYYPPVYAPPRYMPVPPQVVIAAPPVRLQVPVPGWQPRHNEGWR
jgi:hypothetical protein